MPVCDNCGAQVAADTKFCPKCGKDISMKNVSPPLPQNSPVYQQPTMQQGQMYAQPMGYGYTGIKTRTTILTITLVLNYIFAGIFILIGFVLLIFGIGSLGSASSLEAQLGTMYGGYNIATLLDLFALIGIILLVIGILYIYLTYRVGRYGPTAKTILLVLNAIFIVLSVLSFDIIGLEITVVTVYALQFDQQTKLLFEPSPSAQMPNRSY